MAEADDVTKQNGDMDSGDGKRSQQTKKKGEKGVKGVMKKFTHPWLLTSLKSHTGNITDMAFSPNGKYLVTTGDGGWVVWCGGVVVWWGGVMVNGGGMGRIKGLLGCQKGGKNDGKMEEGMLEYHHHHHL